MTSLVVWYIVANQISGALCLRSLKKDDPRSEGFEKFYQELIKDMGKFGATTLLSIVISFAFIPAYIYNTIKGDK